MGVNCRIKYKENGDIDYAEAANGNRSLLFDALRTVLGDEKAVDYYALTETEVFKDAVKANYNLYKDKILNSFKTAQLKSKNNTNSVEYFKNTIQNGKWGMLTAENPNAVGQSVILNLESNAVSVQWLKYKGYNTISIEGKYGIKENSFFVENLSTQDAIEFAKEFKQESVATNIGLIYQDGTMNPIKKGEEVFGGEYEDFFSTIKINGKDLKFKIEYDFNSNIPSQEDGIQYQKTNEEQNNNRPFSAVIEKLKQTGLADNIYSLTNEEIQAKLVEIGAGDTVSKQLANGIKVTAAGFTYKGSVYLNSDIMTLDTPIHEMGHLYLNMLRAGGKDTYEVLVKGMNLAKSKEAEAYRKHVKKYQPNLKEGTSEFYEEVLAQAIGDAGAKFLEGASKGSFMDWLEEMWDSFKDIMGLSEYMKNKNFKNITFEQFTQAIARDLFDHQTIEGIKSSIPYASEGAFLKVKDGRKYKDSTGIDLNKYKTDFIDTTVPVKTLDEVVKEYEGRLFFVTSDFTGVGTDSEGDSIEGGVGYLAIKNNVDDKIGFASLDDKTGKSTLTRVKNIYGENTKVAIVVMAQTPSSTLGNYYGAKYLGRGLRTLKNNLTPLEYQKVIISLESIIQNNKAIQKAITSFENSKEGYPLKEPLLNLLDNVDKYNSKEFAQEFIKDTTFEIRRELMKTIFLKNSDIAMDKSTSSIKRSLEENGFNAYNFLKEYGDNTTLTEQMIKDDKGGLLLGGFEMLTTSDVEQDIENTKNKGIQHPQFNGKIPSNGNHFILDGAYELENNFTSASEVESQLNPEYSQEIQKEFKKFTKKTKTDAREYKELSSAHKIKFKEELNNKNPNFLLINVPSIQASVSRGLGIKLSEQGQADLTEKATPKFSMVEQINPENSSNYANLTEDGQGNFVFYHRGNNGYETIRKSSGATLATSKTEAQAINKVGGLAMYYTRETDTERMVSGTSQYMVKVPMEKVYDFNTDTLNLIEQAEVLHEKEHPNKAFDVNSQLAYITKLAAQNGYDMVVSEWGDRTRAQTTKELTPLDVSVVDGNQVVKSFKESYKSNTEKGFESIIPKTKGERLQEVYEKINKERNSKANYDSLYSLYTRTSSYSQEEIGKMINDSDISEELKSEYNTILSSEEQKRSSKLKKGFKIPTLEYKGVQIFSSDRVSPVNGKNTGEIELKEIISKEKGKGYAREALNKFLEYTDALGKNVYLDVYPRDLETTEKKLREFYSSVGFRDNGDGLSMTRLKKKLKAPSVDENGEATAEVVFQYAKSNEQPLSKEETIEAKNTAIAFGVNTSQELNTILQEAFVKDGMIVFDKTKMAKAGFTEYEISKILSTKEIKDSIKKAIPMLKNTNFELGDYPSEVEVIPSEIGIFGKQKVKNPYETEKSKLEQKQVMTVSEGQIVEKTQSIKQTLPKTLQSQPLSAKAFSFIATILNSKQNISDRNQAALIAIVKELKEEVADNGIDLKDIENRTTNIANLQDFVEALQAYIADNSTFDFFTDIYDEFFDLNQSVEQGVKNLTENDIVLDTELSEYELFRDFSLIRKDKNIYTKVNDKPVEELRENFKQVFSQFTDETIQSKVPSLEVEDFEADFDTIERLFMWKSYLGSPLKTKSNAKVESISNKDFKKALKNPYKKVTENGVELVSDNPLTRDSANLFEKEEIAEQNLIFDDNLEKRKQALQDKNSIAKIETDYQYIEPELLATKNNEESFVRTPNGVFERVYQKANVSFFSKVTSENKNYSDVNFSNYSYLETEGNTIEAKKYYTKTEIESINSKNFNCK